MLSNAGELREFKQKFADHGFSISALSCHGNPLHPIRRAPGTIRMSAARPSAWRKSWASGGSGFQRLPGRLAQGQVANWVTCPWPPTTWRSSNAVGESGGALLDQAGQFAADHGVKIAIEMHPGFVVYSPETMLKLRSIAGPAIAAISIQPHVLAVDRPHRRHPRAGDCIFHVHAKDTQIYDRNLPLTGVLDTKSYADERHRA